MRKFVLISVAAALLVPALPASAAPAANTVNAAQQTASSQPAQGRDEAAPDPQRQICVSEQLSNSRMPRRVCRTAREWQLLHGSESD
jgi:hypothetical protein